MASAAWGRCYGISWSGTRETMIRHVSFKNNKGVTLRGFAHIPTFRPIKKTAVIFLHGFPGRCIGTAARFCRMLEFLGFLCLRFGFSGSPPSDGKFEDKTMSQEVMDIRSAIDFLERKYDYKKVALIGISTGAIDAALYAHTDKRVEKLVLLSGVRDLKNAVHYDFSDEQIRTFLKKGYIVYQRPGHWVHRKKLKKKFYDEFFTLNIPAAIKKYRRPLLIVHGSNDVLVPEFNAHELYKIAHQPKKLVIVRGADHTFSKLGNGLQVVWWVWKFLI